MAPGLALTNKLEGVYCGRNPCGFSQQTSLGATDLSLYSVHLYTHTDTHTLSLFLLRTIDAIISAAN